MSDLVKQLRELETKLPTSSDNWIEARELQLEAAARIEALEAALKPFADTYTKAREDYAFGYPEGSVRGVKAYDNMPGEWPMVSPRIAREHYRHAASLLEQKT